jgi:threonine synthase
VLTGHGLKDPQTALAEAGSIIPCEPDLPELEQAVLG